MVLRTHATRAENVYVVPDGDRDARRHDIRDSAFDNADLAAIVSALPKVAGGLL